MNDLAQSKSAWYGEDHRRDPLFTGGRLENETQYNYHTRHAPRRPTTTYGNALLAARSINGGGGAARSQGADDSNDDTILGFQRRPEDAAHKRLNPRKPDSGLNDARVTSAQNVTRKGNIVAPYGGGSKFCSSYLAHAGDDGSTNEMSEPRHLAGAVRQQRATTTCEDGECLIRRMPNESIAASSRQFTHNKQIGIALPRGGESRTGSTAFGEIGVGGGAGGSFGGSLDAGTTTSSSALSCSCINCEGSDCMVALPGSSDPVCTRCVAEVLSGVSPEEWS